jgi:aryl-alcohol dehydrogenase-like predicted oxidoreductase
MQDLVAAGKTRYWGLSNHSAAETGAFLKEARIAGVEDYYNIAGSHRDADGHPRVALYEEEMIPLLKRENLGCLAFSPMDTGLLAPAVPEDPALAALAASIDQVADDLGTIRASVCVAWVLHQGLTCVLAGSESPEHVDANLAGTRLELPAAALAALDRARQAYRATQQQAGVP